MVCSNQAMLHFIYTDTLLEEDLETSNSGSYSFESESLMAKLLEVADEYDLSRMKLLCESHLCKSISVESVSSILALADRHHAMELRAVCLKFAAENLAGD